MTLWLGKHGRDLTSDFRPFSNEGGGAVTGAATITWSAGDRAGLQILVPRLPAAA